MTTDDLQWVIRQINARTIVRMPNSRFSPIPTDSQREEWKAIVEEEAAGWNLRVTWTLNAGGPGGHWMPSFSEMEGAEA